MAQFLNIMGKYTKDFICHFFILQSDVRVCLCMKVCVMCGCDKAILTLHTGPPPCEWEHLNTNDKPLHPLFHSCSCKESQSFTLSPKSFQVAPSYFQVFKCKELFGTINTVNYVLPSSLGTRPDLNHITKTHQHRTKIPAPDQPFFLHQVNSTE